MSSVSSSHPTAASSSAPDLSTPDPTAAPTLADLVESTLLAKARAMMASVQVPDRLWELALRRPLRDFLSRPGKQFRGRLVRLGWSLAEPERDLPPELPAFVELIHAGSLIVDDIQDDSTHRRGQPTVHRLYGVPLAINTGNFLYFWPLVMVKHLGFPCEIQTSLYDVMSQAMLRCHYGQALDLSVCVWELSQAECPAVAATVTELKTGSLLDLAGRLGTIAAGANTVMVNAVGQFGNRLGIGLQMLDDLGNLLGDRDPHKRHEDLRHGRPTWGWAWLAETTDADTYRSMVDQAQAVAENRIEADVVAQRLFDLVADHGRCVTRGYLQKALAELNEHCGPSGILTDIEREIERLQRSYL